MPFADVALARRIERAECRLLSDAAASAAGRREDPHILARGLAGGVATYTGPGSPLNKLAGLGFEGPVGEESLAEIERAFADRGEPLQAEVASLADPSVGRLLTDRGYVLQNVENVLGAELPLPGTSGQTPAGIEISIDESPELDPWLDTVVTGFAHPDVEGVPTHESFPREALEQPLGDLALGEGFLRYVARRDGVVAGCASLRLFDGIAQLCGAATLPEHRRRGVQSALLASRLSDAAERGCDLAVVTTQPGSKSQLNVERQGFALLYTRSILVREV